jgi:glutamine amidotransferase
VPGKATFPMGSVRVLRRKVLLRSHSSPGTSVMCRFVYYQGPPIYLSSLLTEPEHSLIHQSVRSHMREEPLNGDGFGVGWYQPRDAVPGDGGTSRRDVGRFRSITPAWSNHNLEELARVVLSPRILAHVRAASPGSIVAETNSHPFRDGPLLFMHNGDIGGFRRVRRALLERLSDEAFQGILGSTDSEHFFALFQDELMRSDGGLSGAERMAAAFRRTLEAVLELRDEHTPDQHIYLNVVITDGSSTLISRFTTDEPERSQTLFMIRGGRFVCTDGVCHILDEEEEEAVLVSSEPLSSEAGWTTIPTDTLVLVHESGTVESVPII